MDKYFEKARAFSKTVMRDVRNMKMKILISCLFVGVVILAGCSSDLGVDPGQVTRVEIGMSHTPRNTIDQPEEIETFLSGFSFGGERDYTVKHKFNAYISLHSSTGRIAYATFEDRKFRFKKREYVLSRTSAQQLKAYLKEE